MSSSREIAAAAMLESRRTSFVKQYAETPTGDLVAIAEKMHADILTEDLWKEKAGDHMKAKNDLTDLLILIRNRNERAMKERLHGMVAAAREKLRSMPEWPWWRVGDIRVMDDVPFAVRSVNRGGVLLVPLVPEVLDGSKRPHGVPPSEMTFMDVLNAEGGVDA